MRGRAVALLEDELKRVLAHLNAVAVLQLRHADFAPVEKCSVHAAEVANPVAAVGELEDGVLLRHGLVVDADRGSPFRDPTPTCRSSRRNSLPAA